MINHLFNLIIVFSLYVFTYIFLEENNKIFQKLKLNKQLYVVKNLVKSFNLGYISIVYSKTLINYLH